MIMEENYYSLLIEDEKETSDYIKQLILKLCPQIRVLHQAFTLDEALGLINGNTYHIVFMDIQLPSGTSFDLLQNLKAEREIDFEIIFITGDGASENLIKAIKYSAIDFLYKPVDSIELVLAVNKAMEKLKKQNYKGQIELLLNRLIPGITKSTKIALYLHNGVIELFDINHINYLKADGVITYVFLKDGKKIVTTKNLGFYKELLLMDYNFRLISNSILVNVDFIKRYNHRDHSIILCDGTVLWASKRFGKVLKDSLFKSNPVFQIFKNLLSNNSN